VTAPRLGRGHSAETSRGGAAVERENSVETSNRDAAVRSRPAPRRRYTLKAEQTGAIDHPKAFDLFKQRAMNHALATRPAGSVGEGFVAAAGEALVFEETSHKGKITEKTLGCLGASDAMDLDPRYLPAVHFNINPNYTCSWNHG